MSHEPRPQPFNPVQIALTLQQPWPWAIVTLGSRIINRGWFPNRDIIGRPIGLHGGVIPRGSRYRSAEMIAADLAETHSATDKIGNGYPWLIEGIFAVVTVKEVVQSSSSPWFQGPYGWVLDDVTILNHPIPVRGMQGFWSIPDRQRSLITRALAQRPATASA